MKLPISTVSHRMTLLPPTLLIGLNTTMSFVNNKTASLWQTFMPRRNEIRNATGPELYSVDLYPDPNFFHPFDANREFSKWAAMAVSDTHRIPDGMEVLHVPEGQYAVFVYQGKPSMVSATYQEILTQWLPSSGYLLDHRPHLAVMGAAYRGEHPDSEEELWIPVRPKV